MTELGVFVLGFAVTLAIVCVTEAVIDTCTALK